jgi:hypothetical protein
MKKLFFGAVIMVVVISPALAGGRGDMGDGSCKACPSWRSPAPSDMPPVVGSAFPVCRLVRERIGTRHGHPVYQTRQVCGGETAVD